MEQLADASRKLCGTIASLLQLLVGSGLLRS
jgi:hypothetical protein